MVTESDIHSPDATPRGVLASRALAADAADLFDVSAALGSAGPRARRLPPACEAPPFVWVRLIAPGDHPTRTVRAGWLVPWAVELIAAEAEAASAGTEVQVIVPLDSGDDPVGRVRELCARIAPGLKVTIDVQASSTRRSGGRWRPTGGSRPASDRFRAGTWLVFGPLGATS